MKIVKSNERKTFNKYVQIFWLVAYGEKSNRAAFY